MISARKSPSSFSNSSSLLWSVFRDDINSCLMRLNSCSNCSNAFCILFHDASVTEARSRSADTCYLRNQTQLGAYYETNPHPRTESKPCSSTRRSGYRSGSTSTSTPCAYTVRRLIRFVGKSSTLNHVPSMKPTTLMVSWRLCRTNSLNSYDKKVRAIAVGSNLGNHYLPGSDPPLIDCVIATSEACVRSLNPSGYTLEVGLNISDCRCEVADVIPHTLGILR